MNAYVKASEKLSGAMRRVANALADYAPPEVRIVPNPDMADLIVVHTIGTDVWPVIDNIKAAGKEYAVMQYCLRSTQAPTTEAWLDTWRGARCVWSYYDLDKALHDDGMIDQMFEGMPFYFAPLGADVNTFEPAITVGDRYAILTSGYVAESECVGECFEAAARVGRRVFHLGPEENFRDIAGDHVTFGFNLTDDQLARAYSRSDYVAGMRRCEGFEMPAVEGLFCGARPVMLDAPHYRQWFDPWAEFVPEAEHAVVVDALANLFEREYVPVEDDEIRAAHLMFDWQGLVAGFWRRVMEGTTT